MSDSPVPIRTRPSCPECGEEVAEGEAFCENCGAELVPGTATAAGPDAVDVLTPTKVTDEPEAPPSTPVRPRGPAAKTCAACGGRIAEDGYCESCGAPAVSERDHWAERPAPWVGGVSDRGRRHHRNEDAMALAATPEPGSFAVLVVCDGVSSSADSDIASLAGARAARDVLAAPGDPDASAAARIHAWTRRLADAAEAANEQAVKAAAVGPDGAVLAASPPSCTFVAAVVDGPVVVTGWIGDSRAYWLPDAGTPEQLSTDDSWAAEAIALGVPRAEAEAHKQAHAITRWLGADSPGHEPRTATAAGTDPGWLLVCSDGLWNYCSPADDVAALVADTARAAGGDPARTADALVTWANAQGGHDNITVALARLGGPSS